MQELNNIKKTDVYTQFENWLSNQPYWLQDATYCIYHGIKFEESQIATYAEMCIAQAKNERLNFRHLIQNESKNQSNVSKMAVKRIFEITGVNALSQNASLDFSEDGVTVIYGLNGAGKSGFMRIFKHLSGNPFEEPIQPNVFKKDLTIKPSCKILLSDEGIENEISCNLTSVNKQNPLANCDVFDTRISNEYITKTNVVSYQPFVFTVLTELSNLADRISSHVITKINSISNVSFSMQNEFLNRKDIGWIQNLNSDSVFPEQFVSWTSEQQKDLEEISSKLVSENVNRDIRFYEIYLHTVSPILESLVFIKEKIDSIDLSDAYKKYNEAKHKYDIAKKLFSDTADDFDKISLNSSEWKELWRIAKEYYETFIYKEGAPHFGEESSICPLCHQSITNKTVIRFESINEYVNGTCSNDYTNALNNFRSIIQSILSKIDSIKQTLNQLENYLSASEISIVENIYQKLKSDLLFTDIEYGYDQITKNDIEPAIELLTQKQVELENNISASKNALQDDGRAKLQEQLLDLKYHKWLYDNKNNIETVISNLKKKKELLDSKQFLTTNKITAESNYLAGALITDAYIERFTKELKILAPKIKVKLEKAQSTKGSTPYKVSIDTDSGIKCKPEDILSEGEQRIVALATFFADATGRNTHSPIIIDDPISSLDYNYENSATNRIVELAKERQVIVFTHRISLLVGLKEACEKKNITCNEIRIRSAVMGNGVPDFIGNYYGKIPNQLNELLQKITEIKKKNPDSEEYQDSIGKMCQQFRICVERTVEDELLFGVVKRFSRQIRTVGLLQKLPAIEKEDCDIIDRMMTKYSYMEHSQPAETPSNYYDIDEIQKDVRDFKDWLAGYKNRTKNI